MFVSCMGIYMVFPFDAIHSQNADINDCMCPSVCLGHATTLIQPSASLISKPDALVFQKHNTYLQTTLILFNLGLSYLAQLWNITFLDGTSSLFVLSLFNFLIIDLFLCYCSTETGHVQICFLIFGYISFIDINNFFHENS